MFHNARIKLTVWYLLIIMLISILFSLEIYTILTRELERGFRTLSLRRAEQQLVSPSQPLRPQLLEPNYIQTAEGRIRVNLIYINLIIFGVSGVAGYFLAGRTLKPIKIMLEEQSRFVADASHELKTPLTSLRTEMEVYLRSKKNTVGEANALIKSNLEEINALQTLSDNLLQLAKYPKQNGKTIFEKNSIMEIIAMANKKISSLAKDKKITFVNKIEDATVSGDKQSLLQLFVVLFENAIKYSPQNSTVKIMAQKKDHLIIISVEDNGIGIGKGDLPHIFDRFFRADISRSKVNGYGLGLSIAKEIVGAHNGSISVKSDLGKGTTFIVQLPLVS